MTARQVLSHPLFQYSLEIALPIIGYLFLGWTLPVIITFYFFDFLGSEFARHKRHQKILEVNSAASKNTWTIGVMISIAVFFLTGSLAFLLMDTMATKSGALPVQEILEFLQDEGWLLLPLVLFAAHLKDKMTFYMPKKFYDYSFDQLMKNFFIEITVLLLLIVGGLFGYYFLSVKINGLILLGGFVIIKLAFDFLLVKRLDKKAKS